MQVEALTSGSPVDVLKVDATSLYQMCTRKVDFGEIFPPAVKHLIYLNLCAGRWSTCSILRISTRIVPETRQKSTARRRRKCGRSMCPSGAAAAPASCAPDVDPPFFYLQREQVISTSENVLKNVQPANEMFISCRNENYYTNGSHYE
jgi:hypothetical protein